MSNQNLRIYKAVGLDVYKSMMDRLQQVELSQWSPFNRSLEQQAMIDVSHPNTQLPPSSSLMLVESTANPIPTQTNQAAGKEVNLTGEQSDGKQLGGIRFSGEADNETVADQSTSTKPSNEVEHAKISDAVVSNDTYLHALRNTLISTVSKSQKAKATRLIDFILMNGKLTWDRDGSIRYNHFHGKNSSLLNLINVATSTAKIKNFNMPGLGLFMLYLKEEKAPFSFLGKQFVSAIRNVDGMEMQEQKSVGEDMVDDPSIREDEAGAGGFGRFLTTGQEEKRTCKSWLRYEDFIYNK